MRPSSTMSSSTSRTSSPMYIPLIQHKINFTVQLIGHHSNLYLSRILFISFVVFGVFLGQYYTLVHVCTGAQWGLMKLAVLDLKSVDCVPNHLLEGLFARVEGLLVDLFVPLRPHKVQLAVVAEGPPLRVDDDVVADGGRGEGAAVEGPHLGLVLQVARVGTGS